MVKREKPNIFRPFGKGRTVGVILPRFRASALPVCISFYDLGDPVKFIGFIGSV